MSDDYDDEVLGAKITTVFRAIAAATDIGPDGGTKPSRWPLRVALVTAVVLATIAIWLVVPNGSNHLSVVSPTPSDQGDSSNSATGVATTAATPGSDTSSAPGVGHPAPATPDGPLVPVTYERVQFHLVADLTCTDQVVTPMTDAVIETWADLAGKRWRTTVTYPDGTTRSIITTGGAVYPTIAYVDGDGVQIQAGCGGDNPQTLGVGPDRYIYGLNRTSLVDPSEVPYLDGGYHMGTMTGTGLDSLGRSSNTWQQQISGTGSSGTVESKISQTTQWFVGDVDGLVLERRYSNTWSDLGTVTTDEVRTDLSTFDAPASIFDHNGWPSGPGLQKPTSTVPTLTDVTIPSAMPSGDETTCRLLPFHPTTMPPGFSQDLLGGSGGQVTIAPDGSLVPIGTPDPYVHHYAGPAGHYIDVLDEFGPPAFPPTDTTTITVLGVTAAVGTVEDGFAATFDLPSGACHSFEILAYGVSRADFIDFLNGLW
ncbi:MAG: hypothetical protein JWR83_3108 [Aeromicrobium sp.]|nr:hypothetical protein [Aeromicrobium sp.]